MDKLKSILILSIILMMLCLIPSSFAIDSDVSLNDASSHSYSNQALSQVSGNQALSQVSGNQALGQVSEDNVQVFEDVNLVSEDVTSDDGQLNDLKASYSDGSNDSAPSDLKASKDYNELGDSFNGENPDDGYGIDVDQTNIVIEEGETAYINGTLYEIGDDYLSEFQFYAQIATISYTYTGSDGITHSGTVETDDYGEFSIDLSHLTAALSPYTFIISCEDEYYISFCFDNVPANITVNVSVEESENSNTTPEIIHPSLYVAVDGNDDNDGSEESPFASISKAMEVVFNAGEIYDVFVKSGEYFLDEVVYSNSVNIIGLGDVVFDLQHTKAGFETKGKFSISNIVFKNGYGTEYGTTVLKSSYNTGESLTVINCSFIDCTGYNGGAITTYYKGNAVLTVINSTFINCVGSNYGGAICVSEISNASIESCSFVNCSAKYGGAITFTSSDNSSTVNYCIFANNMATSNGNDIYTKAPLNANYNYWGKNTGADESSVTLNLSSVICDRWVILDVEADLSKVAVGENIQFGFDLTKYTDGVAVYSLDKLLPELLIDLTCDLGTFSPASFMTVDGMANTTYTPLYNGSETVNVNVPTTSLSFTFDVLPSSDNLIFVSIEGSDSTGDGSESNPFRTIEKALTQVTEAKDTIYIKKGTYKEHDLSITENVRIIGENEDIVIIDGEKAGRIFAISEDAEVFFKFLTLTNGKVNYDDEDYETGGKGGAILIDGGDLTLNKVKIFNSTAAAGGAIANIGYSSKLIIQDSLFDGNSLDSEAGDYYFDILSGAAIYSDSSLVITNTTFSNNDADTEDYSTDGGAIAILSSATISNCSFTNNSASGYGGAIAIDAFNTASIILINNIFDSNNALSGGAIYSCLSKLTSISENSFTNNSAVNYGGAIYVFGLKTIDVIDNNNFTSNCAKYGPSIALKYASSTLIANLFEENYNSGISSLDNSIYVDSANVGTSNLTFLNNDTIYVVKGDSVNLTAVLSDEDGNPICNANISFLLDGEPVGNAITDNMGIATLLYNTNQTLNSYLVSGSFAGSNENYTSNVKSGILKVSKYYWFIGSQGYFTLQDAVDASGEGDTIIGLPGVYAYEEVSIGDRMKKIHKNVTIKAEALGEIIMTGVNGRLFNVANKHSADNIQAPSALVLENLIIENCSDEYGGAIYNDAYLTIINCILRNNHATTTEASSKFQGATIMSWGDLKIINSTFINNTGLSGSAINSDTLRGNLSVIDSIFIGNIANESTGGAIFASGGTTDHAYLRNCTFINNTADCGGAIFSIVDMTIEDSHFINNTASEQSGAGGAIYSSKSDLNLDNVYIEGSSASYGGALYLLQSSYNLITSGLNYTNVSYIDYYRINNSVFVNNHAEYEGGTIFAGYITLSHGFIENSSFINSHAGTYGGVIANYFSNLTIDDCDFINASAGDSGIGNGGAIFNGGLYYSPEYGMYFGYESNVSIRDSRFVNTSAINGGALYNEDAYAFIDLYDSNFTNISALQTGGVICNNGTLRLRNNNMNNTSAANESCIYNFGCVNTLTLIFLDNQTVYTSLYKNSSCVLNVSVTDDMGNTISGREVQFYINDLAIVEVAVDEAFASYEYALPGNGTYIVSGIYTGVEDDETVKTGLIITYMPAGTSIIGENTTIVTDENYTIQLIDENGTAMDSRILKVFIINVSSSIFDGLSEDEIFDYVLENGNQFVTDSNASVSLADFTELGDYLVYAVFAGDMDYAPAFSEFELNVTQLNTVLAVVYTSIGSDENLTIKLTDIDYIPLANRAINISVANYLGQISYYDLLSDDEGLVSIALDEGSYLVRGTYDGEKRYVNSSFSTLVTVSGTDVTHTSVIKVEHTGDDARDIQRAINRANPGDTVDLGDDYAYVDVTDINITKNLKIIAGESTNISGYGNIFNILTGLDEINITGIDFIATEDNTNFICAESIDNGGISQIAAINIIGNEFGNSETVNPNSLTILHIDSDSMIFNPSNSISITGNTLISGIDVFEVDNSNWIDNLDIIIPSNNVKTVLSVEEVFSNQGIIVLSLKDLNGVSLANKPVSYVIGGKQVNTSTDESGKIIVEDLSGNALINFAFAGDDKYDSSEAVVNFTSGKLSPKATAIRCSNMTTKTVKTRTGEYFIAKLVDDEGKAVVGKTVQIGFNGKIYTRTSNATGEFRLQVNLNTAGGYTFAISFLGDDEYKASFAVAKVTVVKK